MPDLPKPWHVYEINGCIRTVTAVHPQWVHYFTPESSGVLRMRLDEWPGFSRRPVLNLTEADRA